MHSAELHTTPLVERHRRAGARLAPFAGWLMPIQYPDGILREHKQTRTSASLFDTCHMGELLVQGSGAAEALQRLLPRRVTDQKVGTCRYNFLTNGAGGVRDDLLVYRLAEHSFLLVVNAGPRQRDVEWLAQCLPAGVELQDRSASYAKLDLQGPLVPAVLADLGVDPAAVPGYFRWSELSVAGIPLLLSRTGYTGELGVELYCAPEHVVSLWDHLVAHPAVAPAGLGARDTLRLEMGYPLYGDELDEQTTPDEAGFGALLAAAARRSPHKRLVGLALDGRRAARAGAKLLDANHQEVGVVTSGAFAPSLGHAIALAYVQGSELPALGCTYLLGQDGTTMLQAQVVEMPFYKDATVRQAWRCQCAGQQ